VTNYFTDNGSTVTLCVLDLSKAFDKVDHSILMSKLMKLNVPKYLIEILYNWYANSKIMVKWENIISSPINVALGVRQGGILSPSLFAIYINDLIITLKSLKLGCYIRNEFYGCIIYADDILLLAQSFSQMQKILHVCEGLISDLHMEFNVGKCCYIRCGSRYNQMCGKLVLNDQEINKCESFKYLGVYLKAGRKLKVSLEHSKLTFYRAFNAIYSKCHSANSEIACIHLLKTMCIPMLLYCIEAMSPELNMFNSIDRMVDTCLMKIFSTFDKQIIMNCRTAFNVVPSKLVYELRAMRYRTKLRFNPIFNVLPVFELAMHDVRNLIAQHDCLHAEHFYCIANELEHRSLMWTTD